MDITVNEKNVVLELFSYSSEEQETFPYIYRYMQAIVPVRDNVLDTADGRKRYMLAGLFLTYRAFNHWGRPMTTEASEEGIPEIHKLRLSTFKSITGKKIGSTKQYLKMIKLNWIKFLLIPANKYLFSFVTKG